MLPHQRLNESGNLNYYISKKTFLRGCLFFGVARLEIDP